MCVGLFRHRDRRRIHRDFFEARHHFGRSTFLITCSQMFGEKLFRSRIHRHIVYRTRKTVSFIGSHNIFNGKFAVAQRDDDLIGFALIDPGVVGSLDYQ